MSRRLDGNLIQPSDLTPDVYEGFSIVENIVLASSNHLRAFLNLREDETIAGPVPKIVTRKNPSLDNYFAELLLRTCYSPVNDLPNYEEHVIRGSQVELPSALNPRLVGAVLIGIGGQGTDAAGHSRNPDFKKVYDEHELHGTRRAKSVTRLVFNEHLSRFQDRPGVVAMEPMLAEIDVLDSAGGGFYDHLNSITKSLNVAQFRQPGFVNESLDPQWKRAIIGAALMSVCVGAESYGSFDNAAALHDLEHEWGLYRKKVQRMIDGGFLDPVNDSATEYVRKKLLRQNEGEIGGKLSYFTPRRILFGLRRTWHEKVVSFIMGFLFEAMLQAQQSFAEVTSRNIPKRSLPKSCVFIYYEKQPRDLIPHRAILAGVNDDRNGKKAICVFHDPVRQITSVFRSKFLPEDIWRKCLDRLVQKEGEDVWFVMRHEGKISNFALNGTESFVGVPMTGLNEEAMYQLFAEAINS